MIRNYILITFRSMMKNKLFIAINITGLSIAISCCIVAYYNYKFNADFDELHAHASSVYRVNSVRIFQNERTEYGFVPIALGNVMRQVREADLVTRYNNGGMNLKLGDQVFDERIKYVDPEYFDLFSFEFIHGQPAGLKDKTKLFISDELAMKLFNSTDVVGRQLSQVLNGDSLRELQVGAVFKKQPINSSAGADGFSLFDNYFDLDVAPGQGLDENNWYFRTTIFCQINNASRVPLIEKSLQPYRENNNKVREDFIIDQYKLDPLVGMAVRDQVISRSGTWTPDASPIAAVVGCAVMAVMVLLIACFNLTNTSLAISSRRLKEIGVRKVMGSMRAQLIAQFIGETTLICLIALLLGMTLTQWFLLPAFNSLWPYMELQTNYLGDNFLLLMIGALVITALMAGGYPAFYISKFEPVSILKGKLRFGGTGVLSLVLMVIQFALSLIGIAGGIAFAQNARYQRDLNQGFDVNGVVFAQVANGREYETYRNALVQNPDITSVAGSVHQLTSNSYNDPVKFEDKEIETDILDVGENYLKTSGLTLKEGRDFIPDSETDRKESIIVSEEFVRKMAWDKPIGKRIVWMDTVSLYVVGVIKDVYNRGLWRKMQPMMLRYADKSKYFYVIVSAQAEKLVAVNKFMEEQWRKVFPNRLYNGRYMNEETMESTNVNDNLVKMFVFLGAVAMMLSATGLFTLVSLNIIRRMKEIGVRKVLGASVSNITRIINGKFAVLLMVASGLGAWASSYLITALMGSIWAFYQPANILTYAMAIGLMFGIAILSIGSKVFHAARMNPVNSLRDE